MSAGPELACCACDRRHEYDAFKHRCPDCGEALEFAARPAPKDPPAARGTHPSMWRYRGALPAVPAEVVERVTLGEGATPLLSAARIGAEVGCSVWLKDETRNPTGSFKDRGSALGAAFLAARGFEAIGTVSTGNMARSVAAYAARTGLRATIWVGADIADAKLAPIAVHGAEVRRIDAPYGEIYAASLAWSERHGVPFVNSDSALRVEGQKTIALEIGEQLGGRAPDWLIVPTSSGGNFSAIAKGFGEAVDEGKIAGTCRLVAAQSEGCAPIARAWDAGADEPVDVGTPHTVAGAISNPTPPSGARALRWIRRTGGRAVAVSDEAIVAAQLRLAALTGRFVQPASAAGLAVLERLRREDVVAAGDSVVLLLTGAGTNAPPPSVDLAPPVVLGDATIEDT